MMLRPISLTRKFAVLMALFLALQGVQLWMGLGGISRLGEEAAFINAAGKQRMRTLLLAVLARQSREADEVRASLTEEIGRYEETLAVFDSLAAANERLRAPAAEVRTAWESDLKPILAGIHTVDADEAGALLEEIEALAPAQAARIDRLVSLLEENVRSDSRRLAFAHSAVIGVSLVLGAWAVILARKKVTTPLRNLVAAAREIAGGAYDRRVGVASRGDEVGLLGGAFNDMAEGIQERTRELTVLQEAISDVASSLEIEALLSKLAWHAGILVRADLAALVVLDPETGGIQHFKSNIPPEAFPVKSIPAGRGLLGVILKEGVSLRVEDVAGDSRFGGLPPGHPPIRNLLGVPLLLRSKLVGELLVANKEGGGRFTLADESLLVALAFQCASSLENARLHAKAVELATTDGLTGLANRRTFQMRIEEEVDRSERYQHSFTLMILDIDHFKKVNDTYGHPAGDVVLRHLARLLKAAVRNVDFVARYGGEEFVILLPETGGTHAKDIAERIRTKTAKTPAVLPDGKEISFAISLGVACYPTCGRKAAELVERADQALYIAKQSGRDRVCLYRETLKAQLEKDPNRITAMLNENVESLYPIVSAVDVKTSFSRDHAEKVERIAVRLGGALGLPAEEIAALRLAGLLHDIGIVTIPDAVLNKSESLSSEEWEAVRRHPATGAALLAGVRMLRQIVPLVRHHHERFDGKGYPDGLAGDDIPRLARILAVADAYSAMTSDRPQRKAMPAEEARGKIIEGAGTQFDLDVVAAFARMTGNGPTGG
jgi:diguanylate cyclase (GGDEF)-like protein